MRKDSNNTLVTATNSVQKSIVSACFIMKTMLTTIKLYFYFLEFLSVGINSLYMLISVSQFIVFIHSTAQVVIKHLVTLCHEQQY